MSEQAKETATQTLESVTYKLTLKGGGLSVDREVDQATAFQILAAVMGGATRPAVTLSGRGAAHTVDVTRPQPPAVGGLSLREHMDEFEPRRNPDKILAIAAYLTDMREMETFTSDDVKKEFRSASEPVPGNYARDWRWTISNGWIAKADGFPGEYYVTGKGRDALSAKFSDDVKKGTRVNKTARRRRAPKKKPEATA
jgi:hypothetical protein